MVLIKRNQISSLKVDDAATINNYGYSTDVYDMVEIVVNGHHGTMKNSKSTKTYYVTSGVGTFNIDNKNQEVETGDIISVVPNTWLSIKGQNLKALIITNPPFNANDEEWK